jgi:carbonic anhydrase
MTDASSLTPEASLQRLREGNARFVRGAHDRAHLGWNPGIADGQRPFAAVLGCSDSRAPAELVFDQGLGSLFVVRVAGNVVAPSGIGSIEFTLGLGTRLVVVMGHTQCGAVAATVQSLEQGEAPESKNLRSITDRIRPHIEAVVRLATEQHIERRVLLREAVRANIRASADQLRHGSSILEAACNTGQLVVVGAEYELETGRVDFFDLPQR